MRFSPITVAISMVLGVLFTAEFGIYAAMISGGIFAVACMIFAICRKRADLGLIIPIIAFTAAAVSLTISVRSHETVNYTDRYVTVKGVIKTVGKKSAYDDNYKYVLHAVSTENKNGIAKTSDDLLLTTPKKLHCGESISVNGIISPLPKKMNDNGFNTALYYRSQNIFTRIYSEDIEKVEPIKIFSLSVLGGKLCEKTDEAIFNNYSGDYAAMLSAILTGNKSHFSQGYKNIITETAFERVLHPAYLHIWLIAALIGLLSPWVKKGYRDIAVAVILTVYAMLQTSNAGFVRCLICAALAIIYRLRKGTSFLPDTLAMVVIVLSLTTPTILFNVSFVLSVTGSLLIWAFTPYFTKKFSFLPKFLRRPAAIIIVITLFFTPISTYYFSGVCIYAPLITIISAPVVAAILFCAPISLLLSEIFGVNHAVIYLTDFLIKLLYNIPVFVEKLPFSKIHIASPSLASVIALVLLFLVIYYAIKKQRKQIFVFSGLLCGVGVAVAMTSLFRLGTAEFTFVNVGQGDGAIIHTPHKETIVIDGGGGNSWSEYNPGEALFLPYLASEGYNHIELAIVSHYHEDHVEGMIAVLENIKTDMVIAPKITENDSETMQKWAKTLADTAKEHGTEIKYITENTRFSFNDGMIIDVYAPNSVLGAMDENDTTMPIIARYGDFSAIYTGDMSKYAEIDLMNKTDVDADILKVAHHGSRYSSCEEFIDAVSPIYSVISCGEDNVYSHPHEETLNRLSDTQILRTDLMGDIKIIARKNGDHYTDN